ncbi:MAG TPA: hypothetical protein VMX74_14955 [Pirellulales bacterium]|nr:hypothetical protein [Pirellulales bacterium]
MPDLQATIEYPGIQQVHSASITLSHGITSSLFLLNVAPQEQQIALSGDLVLRFGTRTIAFRDCRVDQASMQFDQSGQLLSLTIADRRIDWAGGAVFGRYNVRHVNGQIYQEPDGPFNAISHPERSPAELAGLLLTALGEQNFDVSALESFSEARPPANWIGGPPARYLGELVAQFACRVVLGLDNRVRIVREGEGEQLPFEDVELFFPAISKDKGRKYGVMWGPTRWQVDILLEPVGLDFDDQVKPVSELSYRPDNDWESVGPLTLDDYDGHNCDLSKSMLSVYRWWRPNVDPPTTYGGVKIEHISQIVLTGHRVEMEKVDGVKHPKRAFLWGEFFREDIMDSSGDPNDTPTSDCSDLISPQIPSIDSALGLVRVAKPLTDVADDGRIRFPVVYMRCAMYLRDPDTGALIRGIHPPGAAPVDTTADNLKALKEQGLLDGRNMYTLHEEISRAYIDYPAPPPAGNEKDNIAKVTEESNYYRDALVAANSPEVLSGSARYAGWLHVELDGAIQSVTWSLSISGASTFVQRNEDKGSLTMAPYQDRRADEEAKLSAARTEQLARVQGLFGTNVDSRLGESDYYRLPERPQ